MTATELRKLLDEEPKAWFRWTDRLFAEDIERNRQMVSFPDNVYFINPSGFFYFADGVAWSSNPKVHSGLLGTSTEKVILDDVMADIGRRYAKQIEEAIAAVVGGNGYVATKVSADEDGKLNFETCYNMFDLAREERSATQPLEATMAKKAMKGSKAGKCTGKCGGKKGCKSC